MSIYRRGDVVLIRFPDNKHGHLQAGIRPCVIVQNDAGNRTSSTIIVAPMTTKIKRTYIPTHAVVATTDTEFEHSMVLCEQLRTVDVTDIQDFICRLSKNDMRTVDRALYYSLFHREKHHE